MADANAKLVQGSTTGTPLPSTLTRTDGTPIGGTVTPVYVTTVGINSVGTPVGLNAVRYLGDVNGAAAPGISAQALWNGAGWDGAMSNQDATLLASGAQTSTFTINDVLFNHKGLVAFVNVTAASGTTPSLTVKLQYKDPVSGNFFDVPGAATAAITAPGQAALAVYPGITAVANQAVSQVMTRNYRLVGTITGTTPSFTLSVGVSRMV